MAEDAHLGFPRRDERGRIDGLPDLLAVLLAGLMVGVAALCLYDLVFWLLGYGKFGSASGWLALVLPTWLLVEEFRGWKGLIGRGLLALIAAGAGLALGGLAASATKVLPALVSGGVGAAVAVFSYGVVWFAGTRWLARRFGEGKA
jgi:hypothetical protein